ncbi:MAG: ISL3 family transposase [Syntrophobacteria bacterium]
MSTSLLYHGFGLKAYEYLKTEYLNGTIFFHVQKKQAFRYCTNCRSRDVVLAGRVDRIWYSLPIGLKPTIIVAHLHRLECCRCGVSRLESLEIADARKSYTRAFGRYVVEMAKEMTKAAIAAKLKFVSWNTIKAIIKDDLKRRLKRRKLTRVRYIAIDEIAVKKGHRYLTTVVDLETGEVIYCAEGKDAECFRNFFTKIKRSRKARLEAIAMDMSQAYLKAVELYAPPGVKVIHDRYHLVAMMNQVVDEVRRDEYREKTGEEKAVIKGSRYLLLSAFEKICADQTKCTRLESLLKLNETLHKTHLLKEDLRLFWEQNSREQAQAFIETWLDQARSVGNAHLNKIANTIENNLEGILNYYDFPITTGPLEGINNKIKVLKRTAYGFRDMEYFKLRILFIREAAFTLVGSG